MEKLRCPICKKAKNYTYRHSFTYATLRLHIVKSHKQLLKKLEGLGIIKDVKNMGTEELVEVLAKYKKDNNITKTGMKRR